ncbi:MAG: hypothetical protein HOW97_08145 [Catenulispora sp.]|nr:hypothetical protein [Catenulispora sp.]
MPNTTPAEPHVQAVKYTVNCVPEDGFDSHVFALTVEYRGDGRWGVFRNPHCCLGTDGQWSWGYSWEGGDREPETDAEWDSYHKGREAWLNEHRFDEETALKLAKQAAPSVSVNGITASEALRRRNAAAGGGAR